MFSFFIDRKELNKSIKTTSNFRSILFQAKKAYNEIAKVKRLIPLIALAMILAGLPVLVVSDTGVSLADTGVPHNELTASQTEASNSSASATIRITMYTMPNE